MITGNITGANMKPNELTMKTFLLILLQIPYFAVAQSVDQYVVGTAGDHHSNESVSLSWTIGEVAIETLELSSGGLTQGLHQFELELITLIKDPAHFTVNVFPNPTMHLLKIKSLGKGESYMLCNLQGEILQDGRLIRETEQIDFSSYPSGIYLLHIEEKATHKIIKK